jgi:hypothetical protein
MTIGCMCTNCEETTSVYFMCDKEPDLVWCEVCFKETACGQGIHGEGCPTKVFDDGENS